MSNYDALQPEALIGAFETIADTPFKGIDFYTPAMDNVSGDVAEWDETTNARLADVKLKSRGAVSSSTDLEDIKKRTNSMVYFNESFLASGDDLNNLRKIGSDSKDKLGKDYLTRELSKLKAKERRTKERLLWSAFTGTLAYTLNGASQSVSYSVSSGDVSATNPWDTAGNNVLDDIMVAKSTVEEATGRVLTHAWINDTVAAALLANTQVQTLIGTGTLSERIAKTGQIGQFGGLEWHQYDGKHSSAKFIADKYVVFTPDPSPEDPWLSYQSGTVAIKSGEDMVEVPSPGSWSVVSGDPVGVKVIVKSCFFPVLAVPACVYYLKALA